MSLRIAVFGPHAERAVSSPEIAQTRNASSLSGKSVSLIAIRSDASWGTTSTNFVTAVYQDHVLAVIALGRSSSRLAEQIAVKDISSRDCNFLRQITDFNR